jgi:hypothetical protein
MSEDPIRERWRDWARGQEIPDDRVEQAVEAALRAASTGVDSDAAAAAARLTGGRQAPGDTDLLEPLLARAQAVIFEVGRLAPSGQLTSDALAAVLAIFGTRRDVLKSALDARSRAVAAPQPTPAVAVVPAAVAAQAQVQPRPPAGPTLREFFSENSILLISYVGAFLLLVAAVLYEVYAIGELTGGLRFAGVLGVDLVFGAAGWACLSSRRMRLVGRTYVAIAALLAPLVCVAAYVFLGLHQRGISVEAAVFLTGSALTLLYGGLCVRLRSHAYGYLALLALPVAWVGGIAAVGPGEWHGPAAALLVAAYAIVAVPAQRLPGLGPRFTGHLVLFVHGAALLAAVVTLTSAAPLSWASAATLAITGAGELLAWWASKTAGAAQAGLAAIGLAWTVVTHQLGLGVWQGPATALLVPAYALFGSIARRVPGLGEQVTGQLALFVHCAAIGAVWLTVATAPPLSWQSSATLGLAAAGELLSWLLNRTLAADHAGLVAAGLAWGAGAHAFGLDRWTVTAMVPLVATYTAIGHAGGGRLPVAAAARRLVHPTAGVLVLLGAALWLYDMASGDRTSWWLPVALAILAADYVLHRVLAGPPLTIVVAASAASLAVVAANAALGRGFEEAAAALLIMAAAWGVGAEMARDPDVRWCLRAGLAVQALVPVLFVSLPPGQAAVALLASTGLLVVVAWRARQPAWLLLAGAVLTVDWYWLGRALLPAAPPTVASLALLYSPLPVLLGAAGLGLRAGLGTRWAVPVYATGAVSAVGVPLLALAVGDHSLAGRALIAYAAVAYAAAAVDAEVLAMGAAVVLGGSGLILSLSSAGVAPGWQLIALAALAAAVWAGQLAWRERRAPDWLQAHRFLGLAGSGGAALAAFTIPNAAVRGASDALLAGLAVLMFAGLLVAEGRLRGAAVLDYAAVAAGSVASYFLGRYVGATNPQWYVAAPGLTLLAIGLTMPHDRRLKVPGGLPPAITAAGAVLLGGTTAVQAFNDSGWGYTAWLLVEAVAMVLTGIGMRSRALVVAGAAAVGLGGLRALFVLVEQGLVFAAFGAAALFLLGLGAVLAGLRDRFRGQLSATWREWS